MDLNYDFYVGEITHFTVCRATGQFAYSICRGREIQQVCLFRISLCEFGRFVDDQTNCAKWIETQSNLQSLKTVASKSWTFTGHLRRVIRLLGLLRSGPVFNVSSLAVVLGVSRRTILRDLQLLREADIEINYDYATRAFNVPARPEQLSIDIDCLMHLLWAANLSPLRHFQDYGASIRTATAALISNLPVIAKREVGRLIRSCSMLDGYNDAQIGFEKDVVNNVFEAIRRGSKVRLTFRKNAHVIRQTKVSPIALQMTDNKILLTGKSTVHRGLFEFDLDHVERVDILDEQHSISQRLHRRWKIGSQQYQERNRRLLNPRVRQNAS